MTGSAPFRIAIVADAHFHDPDGDFGGAGIDDRAPPATVERLFVRLPMPAGQKELWMVPGSTHGKVFEDEPKAYAEHLQRLLQRRRRL